MSDAAFANGEAVNCKLNCDNWINCDDDRLMYEELLACCGIRLKKAVRGQKPTRGIRVHTCALALMTKSFTDSFLPSLAKPAFSCCRSCTNLSTLQSTVR